MLKEDNHNILCVRDTGKSVSKSQFPLLCGEIKRWGLSDYFSINYSLGNEKITCKLNGNQIVFSGLDDMEKLKSIFDISSIWTEEANEVDPKSFRELNRRLRGYKGLNSDGSEKYMQIMLSFNPVSELSWLKERFFDTQETGKIMIFGEKQANESKVHLNEKVIVFNAKLGRKVTKYKHNTLITQSTFLDNHFIDEAYIEEMEELKKYDMDEYNVYSLGQWGIPGGTYFNKHNLNERIKIVRMQRPLRTGYFEFDYINEKIINDSIRWVDDEEGYIKIFEDVKSGYPYVGGGDTAGEGSDWNTGCFTNNVTEEDVASLRLNFDEDLYARQMYCLGKYYNDALLGIETNFSTHPNKELERLNYPSLYIREETPDSISGKPIKRYGFLTTKLTRPLALGMLRTVMREHPERIKDLNTLEEMTVFVKNEKGKPVAAEGQHDDMVLGRAVNCYISGQQTKYVVQGKPAMSAIQKDKARIERELRRDKKRFRVLNGGRS